MLTWKICYRIIGFRYRSRVITMDTKGDKVKYGTEN